MKRQFFACMAVIAGAGLCAGAAEGTEEITGSQTGSNVIVSFAAKSPEDAGQIRFYFDTDGKPDTGFVIEKTGADYKYENGKLYLYIGDGKTQEWEALESPIRSTTRNGRVTVCLPNRTLEIADPACPLRTVVAQDDRELKFLDIKFQQAGKEEAPCKRTGKLVEYTDPAGDTSPGCRIDFIKMFVKPHPDKPDTLMFGFTSDFPIERAKLSYHLRLMFRIGEGMGAEVNGETFNYMFESPNRIFRFKGSNPRQWKWEKLGSVPTRFTKQWCEIDIPLAIFKLEKMPDSIMFRLSCERDDFVPDLRYAMPEYKIK